MIRQLRTGDHEISDADGRDPDVLAELEVQIRRTTGFASMTVIPTALSLGAILWSRTSSVGLAVWVALVAINAVHWIHVLRLPDKQTWMRKAKPIHACGGAFWGLLPLLAMPEDPSWQLFVAAFMLGVQASNIVFSSQLRHMFYRFHAPLVILSVVGFLLYGTGAGRWGAVLLLYSALFAAGLSEINRSAQLSVAVLAVRSASLTTGLEQEREALSNANRQLANLARTDPLTGLTNRLGFNDLLSEAVDGTRSTDDSVATVAYIDLDGFKRVNDSLGHRVGDLLLIAVANRLSATLVEGEILSRLGGDEMVVLSASPNTESHLEELGARLREAFAEPFSVEGRTIELGASIGVAAATSSMEPEDLLRFADTALYHGKSQPGTVVEIFGTEMLEELRRRDELETELEAALPLKELATWLQPIIDIETGKVVSAEALVRWNHRDGVRTAAAFIEAAANRGLLGQISQQVLADVVDYRIGLATGGAAPLSVAVNVAPHYLEMLLAPFQGPQALAGVTIELTEESVFSRVSAINDLIAKAHDLGAAVVLDDFGTGYSTLAIAMELDVDGYKIDQGFVRRLPTDRSAAAVVTSIVKLAEAQNRTVVAEGVESTGQATLLASLGVRLVQGYLYSPAVPFTSFEPWLKDSHHFAAADRSS